MKKVIIIAFFAAVCFPNNFAQDNESNGLRELVITPRAFMGASAIIGVTSPGFSYGLGIRTNYITPKSIAGIFLDVDWNRRGGIDQGWTNAVNNDKVEPYKLHYIDLSIGPYIGERFYFASGPYFGFLVSKGEGADFPDKMKNFEIGGYVTTGYQFDTRPRIELGADFKIGMTDLYDPYYFQTSNNITWGLSLRIGP